MKRVWLLVLIALGFSSCSSLQEMNAFAEKAAEGIGRYDELSFSFSGACRGKCLNRSYSIPDFQLQFDCECSEANKADRNLKKVIKVLERYFKQLDQASARNLTNLSTSAIEEPLVTGKYFKKSTLKPYSTLVKNIISGQMDNYRARVLSEHIAATGTSVDTLLTVCAEVISANLIPTVASAKSELEQVYHDLFTSNTSTSYERFLIRREYFDERSKLDADEKALKNYARALTRIQAGYRELSNNRHRLKKEEVRDLIQSYAEALDEILSNF